jgi:hypothetical protein
MDMQQLDGEWSVEKVLEVINKNCRSWRGEGMKVMLIILRNCCFKWQFFDDCTFSCSLST